MLLQQLATCNFPSFLTKNNNEIRILINVIIFTVIAVARTIVAQDGLGMLYKGLGPTTVGYFIQVRTYFYMSDYVM